MITKHIGKYIIPYIFENSELIDALQNQDTIEEEDLEDLHIDLVDFLESHKESEFLELATREFMGIQADILNGDLTYSLIMNYEIEDAYYSYNFEDFEEDEEPEPEYENAEGSIIIDVIFNRNKLDTIQGLVLFPNGDENYVVLYPQYKKPSFAGLAGEL